jgi:hypothetical protein
MVAGECVLVIALGMLLDPLSFGTVIAEYRSCCCLDVGAALVLHCVCYHHMHRRVSTACVAGHPRSAALVGSSVDVRLQYG